MASCSMFTPCCALRLRRFVDREGELRPARAGSGTLGMDELKAKYAVMVDAAAAGLSEAEASEKRQLVK